MVIRRLFWARNDGWLMIELLVALALLAFALLPFAYSFTAEKKLARSQYQRAVAMEIVDGEMEVLAAGGWRAFPAGVTEYKVSAGAAVNLPPGKFTLTIEDRRMTLEWKPEQKTHGGSVVREVKLQ